MASSTMEEMCPGYSPMASPGCSSNSSTDASILYRVSMGMKKCKLQVVGSSSAASVGAEDSTLAAVGVTQRQQPEVESDLDEAPLIDLHHDRSPWNHGMVAEEPQKQVQVQVLGSMLYNPRMRAWVMVTNAEKAWYLRRTGKGINIICPDVLGEAREAAQCEDDQARKKQKTDEIALPFLPGDVVSKIFMKVAFPSILSTRNLNKHWQSNFTTSPENISFQEDVTASSAAWKSYCPVILNMENDCLMGFDRELNLWMRMSLGLPAKNPGEWFSLQRCRGAGSLVCGLSDHTDILVFNVITRERKWLPQRPSMLHVKDMHLLPKGSDAYQVLVVSKHEKEIWCQVYDSRAEMWRVTHSRLSGKTALSNSTTTFLNGNLFTMEYDPDDRDNVMKMEIYSVEEGLWSMIPHPFNHMLHEIESYELLCCRSQVMIVLRLRPVWWFRDATRKTFRNSLMIYRMDSTTLEIRELCRGPPDNVESPSTLFTCDDNAFYFGDPQTPGSFVIEWSLQTQQWTCLPPPKGMDGSFKNKWCTFKFQPGMNPFVRA